MILLELFWGFLRVGCFSFGGAYAAIPLVRDVVLSYGWLDEEALAYMIAVGESTPGSIMVNLATYVGAAQAGLPGALAATTAVVLPAFVIILAIMAALGPLLKNPYFQAVLEGLKPCIVGIILATGLEMMADNCISLQSSVSVRMESVLITGILAAVMVVGKRVTKKAVSPIALILISGVLGMLVYR